MEQRTSLAGGRSSRLRRYLRGRQVLGEAAGGLAVGPGRLVMYTQCRCGEPVAWYAAGGGGDSGWVCRGQGAGGSASYRRSGGLQNGFSGANITGKELEGSLTPLSSIVVTGYTFSLAMAESGIGGVAELPCCSCLPPQTSNPVLLGDSPHAWSVFQALSGGRAAGIETNHEYY